MALKTFPLFVLQKYMSIFQNPFHQVLPQIQVTNNLLYTQPPAANNQQNSSFRLLQSNNQQPTNPQTIFVNPNSDSFLPTSAFHQSARLTVINQDARSRSEGPVNPVQQTNLRIGHTQENQNRINTRIDFNDQILQNQQHISQEEGGNSSSRNSIPRQNYVNYLEDALYSSQLQEYQYQLYQAQMTRNGIRLYSSFQIPFLNQFNEFRNQGETQANHNPTPTKGQGRKKKFKLKVMKKQEECPICLLDIKINARIPKIKCEHKFHKKCLEGWMIHKKNCPMCRLVV